MIVKRNKELLHICVILALIFAVAFAILTLQIGDRLRDVIGSFTAIAVIKVFLNCSLLFLLGLLWLFYHRRARSGKKVTDLALHAMQQAVENMQIGVTITDKNGIILYSNPADAEMHGYQAGELIGKDVRIFASPERCKPMSEQELKDLKRFRRESSNVRKDGSVFPVQLMSDIVMNNEDEVVGVITTCEDITERKNNELVIQHIAYYDALTGLPNRSLFTDLLKKETARAKRHKQSFAVLFIDLDRFKVINDTLGHTTGDLLLHMVAHRLKNAVRESDTVSRLSGDEFIVLITDVADSLDVSAIAEKIVTTVSEVYVLNGTEIFITASIGISIYPTNCDDIETLMVHADTAMYQAKEQGGNSHQFYNSSVNANAARNLSIENSLRKAVERNELLLYYQPLVDLNTGRIVGAEALLRWHNQDQGLVSPKEIISLAEETGLIIPIGEWLFRTACAQRGGRVCLDSLKRFLSGKLLCLMPLPASEVV